MAEELGMTRQNLHRILTGRAKRGTQTRRISQYLGVSEEVLFPENGEQIPCQKNPQ